MTLTDFLQYIWAPFVAYFFWENRNLREKLLHVVSRDEVSKMISEYLDPRLQPLEKQLEKIDTKLDEVVLLLATWRNQDKA